MKFNDRAPDLDFWFRPLVLRSHVRKDGKLHHAALKSKKAISPPKDPSNPWLSEISGRLRSIAGSIDDIRLDAHKRVKTLIDTNNQPHQFEFVGIMHSSVKKVRNLDFMSSDVIYTPTYSDLAHSDFVSYNKYPEEMRETRFLKEMLREFSLILPDQLESFKNLDANQN